MDTVPRAETAPAPPAAPPRPVPTIGEPVLGAPVELSPPPGPAGTPTARRHFPPGVAERLATYVYLLVDPRTGLPFLVGRGRGDRCWRHVEAARRTPEGTVRAGRYGALDRIREAESDGRPVRVDILRHGLTPDEGRLVEAASADALGLGQATALGTARRPAAELGADLARRARIRRRHPLVLLRVGPDGADTSYGRARHGWPVGQRWIDPDADGAPRWAAVVAGDLVASVHRIGSWEPSPATDARPGAGRWSFTGECDADLERRYVGRNVADVLGPAPAAVTYVWCGPHAAGSGR